MAKLVVKVSQKFVTGPLYVYNNETFKNDILLGEELIKMLSGCDASRYGFEAVTINKDHQVSFVFDTTCGKKGSFIDLKPTSDSSGLDVNIEGEFSVKLRSGVAPVLQSFWDKMDLRIWAATYNGSRWNGFSAYAKGINIDDNKEIWMYKKYMLKINDVSLK